MGLHVCVSRWRHANGIRGRLDIATTLGQHHELTHRPKASVNYTLQLRFSNVLRVEAVDPWPGLRIHWKKGSEETSQTFHPVRLHQVLAFEPDGGEREAFAKVISELLTAFEEVDVHRVGVGWRDAPHVPWALVERWPDAEGGTEQGAYRTAHVPIVARRGKPSSYEALLTWLASSPERPWRDTAREMVLTSRELFVRHWNRKVYALPRDTLRTRLDGTWEGKRDSVYVFGQRTFLVVPYREGCEVAAALDHQLAGR